MVKGKIIDRDRAMKVFISSTYIDLVEYRKAAHDENHPRIGPRMRIWTSDIREFVNYSWTVDPDRISP
jgi:hypothetical protein